MTILIFGATGMIGQGVLLACLEDAGVERVVTVGRRATGRTHAKLRDLVVADVTELSSVEAELAGCDACFFCLGVSAAGMSEERYTRLTYDLTLAVATTLARLKPAMTFTYVSGTGTDTSERGRVMWARVKGRTENALRALPFRGAYMFRPGIAEPAPGTVSSTPLYRVAYGLLGPLFPLLRRLFPRHITSTLRLGRAMLAVAREGYRQPVLENRDINELAG